MEQTVQRIEVFIKNAAKTDKNKRQRVLFHLLSDFLQQIVVEAEADNKVMLPTTSQFLTSSSPIFATRAKIL